MKLKTVTARSLLILDIEKCIITLDREKLNICSRYFAGVTKNSNFDKLVKNIEWTNRNDVISNRLMISRNVEWNELFDDEKCLSDIIIFCELFGIKSIKQYGNYLSE
jgi:hypothetical protein